MLKQIIQEKNCQDMNDDLDLQENNKSEEDKNDESHIVSDQFVVQDEQQVIIEQDTVEESEEPQEIAKPEDFQFISPEDELQLKNLRKEAQRTACSKKVIKRSTSSNKQGHAKHIVHAEKNIKQAVQDFTFHWPLELHHFWLSSLFGARKKADGKPGFHYGIDMAALKGTPVKAAAAGTVIQSQYVPGYGNNIIIQHNKYYKTRYAHLHRIKVHQGQLVSQGQQIGTVGDTGSVRKTGRDASHLHFEICHNGIHVNPLRYLLN
jgi:murein DD-endopeptidase MepM/ murein hydrolase activator NlpD